jgi:copper homeostasis protein
MILEACVESLEDALTAETNGANRIELCSSLEAGGLTPSTELMVKAFSSLKIPVMVMIRPRGGNFVYTSNEINQMKESIEVARKSGAAGVVFGLLTTQNSVDIENTRLLAEAASPLLVTFHKAIDLLPDPVEGVKELLQIREITRILTSGGKETAIDGIAKIREMIQAADGKITILVAGKVTYQNLEIVKELTGGTEFHGRKIVEGL